MTEKTVAKHCALIFALLAFGGLRLARAQDNYEIQVYGSDTVAPKTTMLELHSNFTAEGSYPAPGSRFTAEGVYPTNHAEHETVEITQGVNGWSEVGFYIFTSARSGDGWQWVGDHIRPRVRAPDSWHWPVRVSLSMEFGYQRALFSQDTWTMELRPIIDKQTRRWYFTVNPALERSFHGPSVPQGVGLSPSAKFSYDFNKCISGGLEYYAAYGSITGVSSLHNQQQQLVPTIDLNVSPNWEINFGVGIGATASTDHLIIKGILGRRFDWTHHRAGSSESTNRTYKRMDRRDFLIGASFALLGAAAKTKLWAQTPADARLEIAPLKLEIAPGKLIQTVAYNGSVPGPLIRWPEGKPIRIDVVNHTDVPEIVHWHGLWIPSDEDGAVEEGSPMIAPGGQRRYSFTPRPAGFRWYHTHTFAGHDLKRATYTGQFGCFYIEPKEEPGAYDEEIFLTLHDWNAYMGGGGDASMDAFYDYATINDRMLGHGDPIKVRERQRVLFHVLNASATATHWLALAGHEFGVVGMDGNEVPQSAKVPAVRLAPAERIDLLVEMNRPGVWVLGETRADFRKAGMGIVVEYAKQEGEPKWINPLEIMWDYTLFAKQEPAAEPDERVPLVFESKFRGHGDFDHWTINGKSYPKTDTIALREGKHYRLAMRNKSSDDHPVHLHRHTFEVTSLDGKPLSGLRKDVVVVKANSNVEIDFVAANPGVTLFHCHQQSHMDFGFMMLFRYV